MRKALTIGELLITMAVIGVIATLVLPGFLKDYHKKIYTTKLKKSVEMLENAVNQACLDNNVSYFYQTPYAVHDKNKQQEFIDKYFKKANVNNDNPFADSYKDIETGTPSEISLGSTHGWGKLVSGEAVSFLCVDSVTYCVFRVDVNSIDGPNIGGRDLFALYLDKKTNKIYDDVEPDSCGKSYQKSGKEYPGYYGAGCYAKLLQDNWVMNY